MSERGGAPVYVKIDEYKEVLDVLDMIRGKIDEIRETIEGINQLREFLLAQCLLGQVLVLF